MYPVLFLYHEKKIMLPYRKESDDDLGSNSATH